MSRQRVHSNFLSILIFSSILSVWNDHADSLANRGARGEVGKNNPSSSIGASGEVGKPSVVKVPLPLPLPGPSATAKQDVYGI